MQRYPVVVCRNCGTEYNATRATCPGYRCYEATPKLEGVVFKQREFRTGPVISNPEAIPSHRDSEGKGAGELVAPTDVIPDDEDTQEVDMSEIIEQKDEKG